MQRSSSFLCRRGRCPSVAATVVLVLVCCLAVAHGSIEESATPAFTIDSAQTLLDLLAEPSAAAPVPAHPLLILFTDQSVQATGEDDGLRAKMRQLTYDLPSSLVRVHEFPVPTAAAERRLIDLLLNGIVARMPALVLFHSQVRKAQVMPGTLVSTTPFHTPVVFPKPQDLHGVGYMELRTWVMSELPARYIDPVTYHLVPSLQFVFSPAETLQTLKLVREAATALDGGRAVLPSAVAMAHLRLTTHGSEEVVAALSAAATLAGNSVLVLATESTTVAAAWGLTDEHTITTVPWESVEAAWLLNASSTIVTNSDSHGQPHPPSPSAAKTIAAGDAATAPQPIATLSEVAEATVDSPSWRAAAERAGAAQRNTLRAWSRAVDAFNTTSPLRKLDSAEHAVHELVSLQQAMKVVFVLRESDEMWFHHHLDVAVKLAARLQQTSVLYNTTTLARNAKAPSRVVRAWTPQMRVEVFWVDAEQLPEVADSLHVVQVPSVLVLAPLQSRYQEVSENEGAEEEASAQAGLRSKDPFIGVHVVNRYDLQTAAYINDATVVVDPPTGKDALPIFPTDSDAVVRFLASQSFLNALQYKLMPLRLSHLRASMLATTASSSSSSSSSSAATPAGDASSVSALPNRRYSQLDHRYYPLRLAEEPMEGPAYVRQILNGSSPLPVLTEEERRARQDSSQSGGAAKSDQTSAKDAKAALAAAKKKQAWEAELARRREAKAARMQRKAAEDAALRAKEREAFQRHVEEAFREEQAAAAPSGGSSTATRTSGGLLVRRPSREAAHDGAGSAPDTSVSSFAYGGGEPEDAEDVALRLRRRRRYAEYKAWQVDRLHMVETCVALRDGNALTLRFRWD